MSVSTQALPLFYYCCREVLSSPDHWTCHAGANDGEELSNTKALDDRGWKGICVDPFPRNFASRTCSLAKHALHSHRRNVSFVKADIFGGVVDNIGLHQDRVKDSEVVTLETKILAEVLDDLAAPLYIDYFSLDTEGSEEEILRSFPFWKYTFGAITVEHNREEPKRSNIRGILEKNGYTLEKEVDFDDWYLNNMFVPMYGKRAVAPAAGAGL